MDTNDWAYYSIQAKHQMTLVSELEKKVQYSIQCLNSIYYAGRDRHGHQNIL